jgi:DMSO/TMAO reductase YedYZ molybdopterin-dependent catalytic subunit
MRFLRLALLNFVFIAPAGRALAAEQILKIITPDQTVTFTAEEFAALPRSEVKAEEMHEKESRAYSGVAMRELLTRVGAPLADKFSGPSLAMAVVVRCKDGYTVLFSLAEFDENFSARTIVLADRENGEILPPSGAPLRIVAPGDKRGARSARQVMSIELVSVAKP